MVCSPAAAPTSCWSRRKRACAPSTRTSSSSASLPGCPTLHPEPALGYNLRMANLNVPGLDLPGYMHDVGQRARTASRALARASSGQKNASLRAIAATLLRKTTAILAANKRDTDAARNAGQAVAFV